MDLVGRSILVVEDEPLVCLDLTERLQRAGAIIFAASHLNNALSLAAHPDLSAGVLDFDLGNADSTAVCWKLVDRRIPFIFHTGRAGYVEGQNIAVQYRWAEGQYDKLPGLARELVDRNVAIILAGGGSDPVKAAKSATAVIPIVFVSAADPVRAGVVASLNRPGANVTGVSLIGSALEPKRLELLRELVPEVELIGVLVNPKYPDANLQLRELREAADVLKRKIDIVQASTERDIESAFAVLIQHGARALLVTQDPFFVDVREHIVALARDHNLPAIYYQREFAEIGGLVTYGTHFADAYRQAGVYLGRILSGEKPPDLPVLQPTRFELVINLKTAKVLGLTVPVSLLTRADELIE
jgi:putative ABC transport system substrate-binding protein